MGLIVVNPRMPHRTPSFLAWILAILFSIAAWTAIIYAAVWLIPIVRSSL